MAKQPPAPAETPAQHDTRLQWWRDAKYGMFIHWGPVSVAGTELSWSRPGPKPLDITNDPPGTVAAPEYDNLYRQFNPQKFDAKQWVRIAKAAGMKYMVLTCKHHDGFSLFHTAYSDHNIANTPFKRDIVKELAQACHAAGMRFGVYYSPRDWYQPDYGIGDNQKYQAFMNGQLRELLSNYGQVDVIWFDSYGHGDLMNFWGIDKTWNLIKGLQPKAIVNNRLAVLAAYNWQPEPYRGDFDTPEQQLGNFQLNRDWESCVTLVGHQWSYKPDGEMMSFDQVVTSLFSTATGGGNLLLNIGPMPTGEIEPRQVDLLKQVGDWTKKYGEAIYETRGGPYTNGKWGGSTHKGRNLYLWIKQWEGDSIQLNPLPVKVTKARLLGSNDSVGFEQTSRGLTLQAPADKTTSPYAIVALSLEAPLADGLSLGNIKSPFDDEVTYGKIVSEAATLTTSSTSVWDKPSDHARLLSGPPASQGYAFHTSDETNPWAIIDLGDRKNVTGVHIENRPNDRRASGLILSTSLDGQQWTPVWQASEWEQVWEVPLTQTIAGAQVPGLPVRFLRLETRPSKPSPLMLQRVEVYAK